MDASTNYITVNGAALEADVKKACPKISRWGVSQIGKRFTICNGNWNADQRFDFDVKVEHADQVKCIAKAINNAGGPADTPDCEYSKGGNLW